MNTYYKLDPNSPYYPYMQDTTVEMSKTKEEKDQIHHAVRFGLASNSLEMDRYEPFDDEYIMYCALNDVPKEIGLKLILDQYFSEEEINNFNLF